MDDVLQQAGFASNPFRIVPPNEMDDVEWAGDDEFMRELLEAADAPKVGNLGTSELVVLHGDYGTGKTNALKYLASKLSNDGQLVAYILRPAVTDKPTWNGLVRSLFSQSFRRDDVVKRLGILRRYALQESESRAAGELENADRDTRDRLEASKLDDIAAEILPESPGFFHLLIDMADERNPDLLVRNWAYLSEKPSSAHGQAMAGQYGVPATGLMSDYDATLVFSDFIRAMTYATPSGQGTDAVYLLIDEVEGMMDLKLPSQLSLQNGLRSLIDSCTEHFFLALASTASDASEMWGILGNPIMQRLSRKPMELPQFDDSMATKFLLEIMHLRRNGDFSGPAEWPLTREALESFIEQCPPPKTPRKLLVSAGRLVFQTGQQKIRDGNPLDVDDVSSFSNWGGL